MPKNDELTLKEQAFIREYLIDLNASAAYRRAGYKNKNVDSYSYLLMVKPRIKQAVQKAVQDRAKRTELNADHVLKNIELIRQNAMRCDASGEMLDKVAALKACELLGRHLKLFTDKVEATGLNGEKLFNEIRIIAGRLNVNSA